MKKNEESLLDLRSTIKQTIFELLESQEEKRGQGWKGQKTYLK